VTDRIPARRVRFTWPQDLDPVWTPRAPELALAANAVSLLMPHAEPYVVASVRAAAAELEETHPELAAEARAYATQEAQHHGQHRRFNDLVGRHYPALGRVERALRWTFAMLQRRSTLFGLAFASGFETIAFVAARWVDDHQSLLRDADPTAATLFLWHLAEEVEHKEVAFDVYQASGGGRLRLAWGTTVAAVVLATASFAATLVMLKGAGRLFSPVAHLRLIGWSLSFVFAALPVAVLATLPGHHPRDLADPPGLERWLEHLDPDTATVPEWALP
jgi:predicted metal-dependent hydrolase